MLRTTILAVLVVALASCAGCARDGGADAIPGVRLGMSPRDVRDRFEAGREGTWQTKVGGGAGVTDDTVLEWNAPGEAKAAAGSRATHARFEFHLGMLVAIRAHLAEAVSTERVDLTAKTVTLRSPQAGGTEITILARDCPTHHDEAEGLVAKAR